MFPWGVLITGLVGVGGTALGAWLNGKTQTKALRLSLDAENERAWLAEKRRVYAACQASFTEMRTATAYHRGRSPLSEDDPLRKTAERELDATRGAMYRAVSEVTLISPGEITQYSNQLVTVFMEYTRATSEGAKDMIDPHARDAADLQWRLYEVMRADLGRDGLEP